MHSKTLISNPIPTTITDHDHDHDPNNHAPNSNSNSDSDSPTVNPHDHEHDQNPEEFDHGEIVLDDEPDAGGTTSYNNPPDSFWLSHQNVTDWLNHHTFIERKTSVKLVPSSRKFDSNQTRSSQRSVSFNHKPQATIIGFRQKPAHSSDGKSKHNDRMDNGVLLFKNRSMPGKSSGGPVAEPRSPRVSCMGRVGSMRGRARRNGFWKKVKTAILTRVRTDKGPKKGR